MLYAKDQSSKFAGFAAALLMAAGINGAVLAGFNQVATTGAESSAHYAAARMATMAKVTLPTVTITAARA